MFRLIGFVLLPVIAVSIVWPDAPQWLLTAILIGMIALVVTGWLRGALVLKCPACGKRVKIGYTTCHHCGYAAPSQTESPG